MDETAEKTEQTAPETTGAVGDSQTETTGAPEAVPVAKHESFFDHVGEDLKEKWERRKKAFEATPQALKDAVSHINDFLHKMDHKDAETPEEVLNDPEIQQAAAKASEGLKVFSGTPATTGAVGDSPKATSDAHLNIGTGGAVTGNTTTAQKQHEANQEAKQAAEVPGGVAVIPQKV